MHRFADVVHGRAPLARTGNVTEGSFRPTAADLQGLSLGVMGLSASPAGGPVPPATGGGGFVGRSVGGAASAPTMGAGRQGGAALPGPVLNARVNRLRGMMRR